MSIRGENLVKKFVLGVLMLLSIGMAASVQAAPSMEGLPVIEMPKVGSIKKMVPKQDVGKAASVMQWI